MEFDGQLSTDASLFPLASTSTETTKQQPIKQQRNKNKQHWRVDYQT